MRVKGSAFFAAVILSLALEATASAEGGVMLSLAGIYSMPSGTNGNGGSLTLPGAAVTLDIGGPKVGFLAEVGLNSRNMPQGAATRDLSSVFAGFGGRWKVVPEVWLDLMLVYESLKPGTITLTNLNDTGLALGGAYNWESGLVAGVRYFNAFTTVAAGSLRPSYLAVYVGYRLSRDD